MERVAKEREILDIIRKMELNHFRTLFGQKLLVEG